MTAYRFTACALLLGLFVMVGCGGGPSLTEVGGTVKMGGKPLDKIQVEFWPEDKGPRSIGQTDSEGRYSLNTDDGKRKGAAIGSHRVVLKDTAVLGDKFLGRKGENVDMNQGRKSRIPDRYADARKTPLKQ